jgi:RNA polymerase sigma-70 factor (ECF subfamily)
VSNPENEWLEGARNGNEEAFTHLVEIYQTPVYNLCFRMMGEEDAAEDASQETFWRAHQSLDRYDPQRSFGTWLLSIAAHYCIDQLRRRRLEALPLDVIPEEAAPDPDTPTPENAFGNSEEKRIIRKMLNKLKPQDRSAIIMRYWYDFSDEEIGKSLNLSVSAVKSRMHRARRELAVLWLDQQESTLASERRHHESPAF